MKMQSSTSFIVKRALFILWLLFGAVESNSATRLLHEKILDPRLPQGAPTPDHLTFSFFLHDIVGGSNPSARAITGIVNNPIISGQLPFAKASGLVFPLDNNNNDNDNDNSNNNHIPFLTGLSGITSNVFQNKGGNGDRLPVGSTIEKLMFGTITVVDDELTKGPELSSGRVGKAQGFYVSSSADGASQVIALTVMFKSGGYVDTICFFGVHLLSVSESQVAVMGGTGKFANAKGYAIIKTLSPSLNHHHQTDGLETVLQFTVYVTY